MRPVIRQILQRPLDTLLKRGLVAEYRMDQRNLLKWSEDFSNAVWGKTGGAISGSRLTEDTSTGSHGISANVTLIDNMVYDYTVWFEKGTRTWGRLAIVDKSSIVKECYINLNTGIITGNTFLSTTTTSENGVWKVTVTFNSGSGATPPGIFIRLTTDSGVQSHTGDGTSYLYVYKAQLELGSTPTDYQKTTDLQTLWNSKKSPVSVTNLIQNGNFALDSNADGLADGLTPSGCGGFSLLNGVQSFTATAQSGTIISNPTVISGHKYYSKSYIKSDSNQVYYRNAGNIASVLNIYHTGSGNFEKFSSINTASGNGSTDVKPGDGRASGWTQIQWKLVQYIDLTALFGAGNEPTLQQCDDMFNTWFDGTQGMDLPLFNGQLGSTTGVDTNDPTITGQGLQFTTDDYVKLPYSINAEQDFTVYLVANVGASVPSAGETYIGMGNGSTDNQYLWFYRSTTGDLIFTMRNNVPVGGTIASITNSNLITGIRLFKIQRLSNSLIVKDIASGKVGVGIAPASPITFNQISIGCLLRLSVGLFTNQPQNWADFFAVATTDAEDKQQLKAVRKELRKRGVILGSKNEFYSDFVGKIAGSTVENANVAKGSYFSTSLQAPSGSWSELSAGLTPYIQNLDGSILNTISTVNLGIAQALFSFNIIRDIEDKGVVIPGSTLAEKVQWCKDNVSSITGNFHCRGTSPTGNKASLAVWRVSDNTWVSPQINVTGVITKIMYVLDTASFVNRVTTDGFVHFIAYAEPSDGVTASTIYTDTANLLITLKNGVVLGG